MQSHFIRVPLLLLALVLAFSSAHAHGDYEADVDEFHLRLDEYRQDVMRMLDCADEIAAAYSNDADAEASAQKLIDLWEEVALHGAIETKASILYPPVWQALSKLQQALKIDAGEADLQAARDNLAVALWQGLGGVTLAANQYEQGMDQIPAQAAPEGDYAEQIAAIRDELEQAVQAYADHDVKQAQKLVYNAYMQRFEFLEADLIAQDAELVEKLELAFNAGLPQLMQQGAEVAAVRNKLARMNAELDQAAALLAASEANRSEVF